MKSVVWLAGIFVAMIALGSIASLSYADDAPNGDDPPESHKLSTEQAWHKCERAIGGLEDQIDKLTAENAHLRAALKKPMLKR
jgi:hypothetical protein